MGMYTTIHFGCDLKEDTPKKVIDILDYMAHNRPDTPQLPNHEFFACSRWKYLIRSGSAYFDYEPQWRFAKKEYADNYNLSFTSNLKNYDGEILKFLNWINPYLESYEKEMLGYYRYEEDIEPTIIYYKP